MKIDEHNFNYVFTFSMLVGIWHSFKIINNHDVSALLQQLDDLYEKVLLEIINGNFNVQEVTEKTLFAYAQEVFKLNDKTHEEILKRARYKPMSEAYLRVELVEAKLNERPSVQGALNPFVIMYLQTDLTSKEKSTICKTTNHPVWKQCFSMWVISSVRTVRVWFKRFVLFAFRPAAENSNENLIVEVYHWDSNISKVQKTIKLCKKYAYSCVRPKTSYQKLIGRTSIGIEVIMLHQK